MCYIIKLLQCLIRNASRRSICATIDLFCSETVAVAEKEIVEKPVSTEEVADEEDSKQSENGAENGDSKKENGVKNTEEDEESKDAENGDSTGSCKVPSVRKSN